MSVTDVIKIPSAKEFLDDPTMKNAARVGFDAGAAIVTYAGTTGSLPVAAAGAAVIVISAFMYFFYS